MRAFSLIAPALCTALAPALVLAEPAEPFRIRRLELGLLRPDASTRSSRFDEYRSLPQGFVLPSFHFAGNAKLRYEVGGVNLLQDDARYRFQLEPGLVRVTGDWLRIPHRLGNDAHSILLNTDEDTFSLSNTLRDDFQKAIETQFRQSPSGVNFTMLERLVGPSLAVTPGFDLDVRRDRGRLDVEVGHGPAQPVQIRVSYFNEKRQGYRSAGTSFGLGNSVETAEAIDYKTEDLGISGEWTGAWGLLRGSASYNRFTNHIATQEFFNAFRLTDATDGSAHQAPSSSSIGGAALGRLSLPPDNSALTGSLGFVARLGRTRLTTDASLSEWRQDAPFMPLTTNSRMALSNGTPATSLAALPARSLNGRVRVFSLSSLITSRPVPHLSLTARFRRYDLDNRTPRLSFPEGHIQFDARRVEDPRISVPYGYATDTLQATAAWDVGNVTLEGGYRLENQDRSFRETARTEQNVGYVRADLRASDWMVLRANREKGSRTFRDLQIGRSWSASFLDPEPPSNLLAVPATTRQVGGAPLCAAGAACNLRFDQAPKDLDRFTGLLELTPIDPVTLVLSYVRSRDDYTQTTFGLVRADNQAFSADIDYMPAERVSLFGYYMREKISSFQRGRQSGGTVSASPLDDWTADIRDDVDTVGGGANLNLIKEQLDLQIGGSYQKANGSNDLFSPPGGTPDVAFSIAAVDDTRLLTLSGELSYRMAQAWRLTVGGWFEDYRLDDAATSGLPNYGPSAFFLSPTDGSYRGHVLYVRASYAW